jgi:hypothetical protein
MASDGKSERPEDETPVSTASHAGARTSLTVAERVAYIVGMMERLEWERGRSARKLAELWGLAKDTVEGHAAEAHRLVTADKDEAVRDITIGARKLFREAVQSGDAKSAKAIGDLWADVAGARAPTKQEIEARVTEGASPAEAARLVREQFGEKASKAVDDGPAESVPETTEE